MFLILNERHKRIRIGSAGLTLALTTHFRVLMSLQINIMKMIIEKNFITIGIKPVPGEFLFFMTFLTTLSIRKRGYLIYLGVCYDPWRG